MKNTRMLFFMALITLLAACNAGKYYAGKRINHSYEEKSTALPVETNDIKPVIYNDNAVSTTPEETPVKDVAPVASTAKENAAGKKNTIAEIQHKNTVKPISPTAINIAPLVLQKNKTFQKLAGEKSVGGGLTLILIGLLLLLLGILFILALGDIGVIFAIIFYIAAAVLFVVGIITLFL